MKTVSNARQKELDRMIGWIDSQVSSTLSVVADVVGEEAVQAFVIDGRRKRGKRFDSILELRKE
jgi:hypothetical protein